MGKFLETASKIAGAFNPILGAGLSLFDTLHNQKQTNLNNQRQMDFAREMYDRQRQDALADMNFQNEYNSPANQMKRFKDANLNPNLIYDQQGTPAVSPRSSSASTPSTEAPQSDTSGVARSLQQFQNVQQLQAQTDLTKQMLENARQEAALKAAQTLGVIASTESTKTRTAQMGFNLGQSVRLADVNFQQALATLGKTLTDTQVALDDNERKALINAQNLQKGVEEILTMRLSRAKTKVEIDNLRQAIKNAKQDYRLKQFDEEMQRRGIPRNSPAAYKVADEVLKSLTGGSISQNISDMLTPLTATPGSWITDTTGFSERVRRNSKK